MADPTSPYDSYDDAVNADRDAEGAKHRKDEDTEAGANETLESLKAAGTSALGVAKEFTNRFREDRAANADGNETLESVESPGEEKKGSFFDRATDFAKDIGGSVRRAAEGTRDTETFSEAKEKAGSAFGVVREEASDAVNNVKSRINERRDAKSVDDAQDTKPQKGDDVADPTAEVVEGEVISSDNDTDNQTGNPTS